MHTSDLTGVNKEVVVAESANRSVSKCKLLSRCRDDVMYENLMETNTLLKILGDPEMHLMMMVVYSESNVCDIFGKRRLQCSYEKNISSM